MVKLTDLYTVDTDSPEYDYLHLCDAPLPEDVLQFLGKASRPKQDPAAVSKHVYA